MKTIKITIVEHFGNRRIVVVEESWQRVDVVSGQLQFSN